MRERLNKKAQTKFLTKKRVVALIVCLFIYAILWAGGLTSHWLFGGVRENQQWLGSLFLLLAGIIVFLTTRSRRETVMLFGFALFGFAAEAVGVGFGFPFGSYRYTDILGVQFLGVPVVIALAWMALISYVRETLLPFNFSRKFEATLAALYVTAIDLVIDPLAVNQLGYWRWDYPGAFYHVPASNFAGWFLTAFVTFYIFQRKTKPNAGRLHLGFSIILFFTMLALIYKIVPLTFIGIGLCLPYFFMIYKLYQKSAVQARKNVGNPARSESVSFDN